MATDLLELSARIIETGDLDTPTNRVNLELSEVGDDIAVVEAFSHVWALRSTDGLILFDTSSDALGAATVAAMRGWSDDAVHSIVYTHGHRDHVGGAPAWLDDAGTHGHEHPTVVAHEAVASRLDRYDLTNGYNAIINQRQFRLPEPFWPTDWVRPEVEFETDLTLDVGGMSVELHHALGETDDHLWAWVPSRRAIFAGDFLIWNFPNAGNPQKVQRYPLEWAAALRDMAATGAELLLPAHGLPIGGRDRIAMVLTETADALEKLVRDTLAMMNEGARLDQIVATVKVDPSVLERPWLRPNYDEPEFVVRNVWRLYGGWYDGNPARLKPAPDDAIAAEVATLAGGAAALAARAREVADSGDLRLAAQLAEWATQADPHDGSAHAARAEIYRQRRQAESSLMAKGIFRAAADESQAALDR
jgi:alkyl sulfatase BDS1-like metallo-beta-lactamase superfamily hydrolase